MPGPGPGLSPQTALSSLWRGMDRAGPGPSSLWGWGAAGVGCGDVTAAEARRALGVACLQGGSLSPQDATLRTSGPRASASGRERAPWCTRSEAACPPPPPRAISTTRSPQPRPPRDASPQPCPTHVTSDRNLVSGPLWFRSSLRSPLRGSPARGLRVHHHLSPHLRAQRGGCGSRPQSFSSARKRASLRTGLGVRPAQRGREGGQRGMTTSPLGHDLETVTLRPRPLGL